jgi:TolA-binding protein
MTKRFFRAGLSLAMFAALAAPAAAANKEHQQLMADIRMLQEQAQQLQNMLGTLTDALKAVNAKIDDQTNATRKAFADQKLLIDNLSSDLRVVRERADDSNVRVASLSQQVDQLRQMIQALSSRSTTMDAAEPPPPSPAGGTPPPAPQSGAASIGTAPDKLYQMAMSNYYAGVYDLAIEGFDAYIRAFPTAVEAPKAQVLIGNCYLNDGKYDKASEAYDKAIRGYPNAGDVLAEAYYKKGLCLAHNGDMDRARESWQFVVQKYPNTNEAGLARQALSRPPKQ